MLVQGALPIIAGVLALGAYMPYARDILKGRVKPARAARIMFTLLLVIALLQQRSLGAGWTLAVTVGEAVGSLAILGFAVKYGVGGLWRIDGICYVLLLIDIIFWLATGNALLALILSMIADTIAFFPTLHKTWLQPESESPLFFIIGSIAPLLNLLAPGHLTLQVALYPLYLGLVNGMELGLIYWRRRVLARERLFGKVEPVQRSVE